MRPRRETWRPFAGDGGSSYLGFATGILPVLPCQQGGTAGLCAWPRTITPLIPIASTSALMRGCPENNRKLISLIMGITGGGERIRFPAEELARLMKITAYRFENKYESGCFVLDSGTPRG